MTSPNVVLRKLRNASAAESLIYEARKLSPNDRLRVDLSNARTVFPNGAVPLAAALEHYRRTGVRIYCPDASLEVQAASVLAPRRVDGWDGVEYVTNQVWEYRDPAEANTLTTAFTTAVEDHVECGRGFIDTLTWCLYEVLDNVFQHSQAASGFVMMQLHTQSRRCVIAVSDTGIGVQKSFEDGGSHRPSDAYEALKLAVSERVTSKSKNMGNGLFGLIRVVGINGGEMSIRSGSGHLEYSDRVLRGGNELGTPVIDAALHQGTTVDWQLNMGRALSLGEALRSGRPAPARLEAFEDEWSQVVLSVRDFEMAIGSRTGAQAVRNRLVNAIEDADGVVILDFEGINVVSSSFADEVLGKLVLARGRKYFDDHVRLANANPTVLGIIDRAIVMRVQEGDDTFPAREVP